MLNKIIKTAKEAGEKILTYYSEDVEVMDKSDDSPLTHADLASNNIILERLNSIDPNTPVISEEAGLPSFEERKLWDKFWIVDPLDGTKEFIKKNGEFTVNIALIEDGEPVIGVIYIPVKKQLYYAQRGEGSFRKNGDDVAQRIYSTQANKDEPLKVVASRSHQSDTLNKDLNEMGIELGELISAGSSLKFCLVAEGTVDIYPRMKPTMEWDVAAGDCIFRNSAKDGQHASPLRYNKPDLKNTGFVIGVD